MTSYDCSLGKVAYKILIKVIVEFSGCPYNIHVLPNSQISS